MDLKSNFIKERTFRWLVTGLLSCFVLFIAWTSIDTLLTFHSVFDDSALTNKQISSFEIGNFALTKTTIEKNGKRQTARFITVKDLKYRPARDEIAKILKNNYGLTKIMGLSGHPSFLIKGSELFWKSQFYLEWGFQFGGLLILGIILIAITEINFRENKKLFTKKIKRLFTGIFFLVCAGLIIEAVLYGRMIHFLNSKYYLGESLVGGIPPELVSLLVVLLWIIIFFERAVPMQKEQDLTV